MTKDVDIDEVKIGLDTDLTYAIEANKNLKKIKEIIDSGANPNESNLFGELPLGIAIQNGNNDIIKLLISYRADVNMETTAIDIYKDLKHTITPLKIAIKNNNIFAIKILLENGANIKTEDVKEAITDDKQLQIIEPLIYPDIDINEKDDTGMTLLMYAAESNKNKEVIDLLMELDADINKTNNEGMTPLMLAIQNKNTREICGTIINKYNADINIKDKKGKSALDYAKDANNKDIIKIICNKLNNK